MNHSAYASLQSFLAPDYQVNFDDDVLLFPLPDTPAIQANSAYFSHPVWANTYFEACHRDAAFRERWYAAAGSWDNKIVVDIGCGPGNLYANLGGTPKLLIGVDVARGALEIAQRIGYMPVLADAHELPLTSEFADIVALNASLHHCDDMPKVLAEAARLVRPGGVLVVDHDPQLTAWHYKGLGLLLYKARLGLIYRFFLRDLYIPDEERLTALATEVHHKSGDGVTQELFYRTLELMGFSVNVYPHNNVIEAAALQGIYGDPPTGVIELGSCYLGLILILRRLLCL